LLPDAVCIKDVTRQIYGLTSATYGSQHGRIGFFTAYQGSNIISFVLAGRDYFIFQKKEVREMCGTHRKLRLKMPLLFERIYFRPAQPTTTFLPTSSPPGNSVYPQTPVTKRAYQWHGHVQAYPHQRRAGIAFIEQRMSGCNKRQQKGKGDGKCDQYMIQTSPQIDQYHVSVQVHRKCCKNKIRVLGATTVNQTKTVAVPWAGKRAILDHPSSQWTPLMRALILNGINVPFDVDQ
jgi:hypothetical protein